MNYRFTPLAAAILAFAAACQDAPTAPTAPAEARTTTPPVALPTGGPSFTTYDPSTRTLGVALVSSDNKMITAADYTVSVTITGGTQPYKQYFWVERCSSSTDCHGLHLYSAADGSATSLTFYVFPEDAFIRVKVYVGDADGTDTWTGVTSKTFIGPSGISMAGPSATCYGGDDVSIGFPFTQAVPPDPINQSGNFRYNACTMTRIWEPKPK